MPSENDRIVGGVLKQLRLRSGMTQIEFAKQAGMGQSFVSKIENGVRALKLSEIFSYAASLGLDPHEVLDEIAEAVNNA